MARRASSDGWMWAVVLGATALVVGLAIAKGRKTPLALEGKPAPSVTLALMEGNKSVSLPDKAGRVVMLDFWATWCGPCRASMPVIQRVWKDYRARGVDLYAVNTERPSDDLDPKIREFLITNRLEVNVALDGGKGVAQEAYNVESLPTLVVLDRAGKVKFSHVGFTGSMESQLRAALDDALTSRATN